MRAKPTGEVTPAELRDMMDRGERLVILDVREPHEYEICHLEGSKLIPLGDLTRRVGELDPADRIVVYCHVWVRSAAAVEFLSSNGFKGALNPKGGISLGRGRRPKNPRLLESPGK